MNPEISVVMASYNAEKTLPQAIDSILNQSFGDFEFIIVDDGSTDRSGVILRNYASRDKRIRLLRNSGNKGLAASLNSGINHAIGNYIARMDSDDWSYPERLKKQFEFMRQNPEIDVLGTAIELVDSNMKRLELRFPMKDHRRIISQVFNKTMVYHPSIMVRKSVYEMSGAYDPNLRWAEDADLWFRMYDRIVFHNLQEVLLKYRKKNRLSIHVFTNNLRVKFRHLKKRRMIRTHGIYLIRDLVVQGTKLIFGWN